MANTEGIYWPGLTRLYDKQVDCGAVLMVGEQAKALVEVARLGLEAAGTCDKMLTLPLVDDLDRARVEAVLGAICFTFGIKENK
jgi:hypothetical protein